MPFPFLSVWYVGSSSDCLHHKEKPLKILSLALSLRRPQTLNCAGAIGELLLSMIFKLYSSALNFKKNGKRRRSPGKLAVHLPSTNILVQLLVQIGSTQARQKSGRQREQAIEEVVWENSFSSARKHSWMRCKWKVKCCNLISIRTHNWIQRISLIKQRTQDKLNSC